uniref:Uncharacterized protein n=1 Tax=Megaviridae environmental sample TaxID=1737588 RepID=A0A5J6VK09_9VIRU|nr:MAG: hypothetical protein [Megaviridae environmental sample]
MSENENNFNLEKLPIVKTDNLDLESKLNKIIEAISRLEKINEIIDKKILDINKMYLRFDSNRSQLFRKTNTFLKFQTDLLNIEKKNLKNKKNLIFKKISEELNELGEYIVLTLISLEDLEIENRELISKIKNKIAQVKKIKIPDKSNIKNLFITNIKNMELIIEFIKLLDTYTKNILHESNKKNIHSNNLKLSLCNKKKYIIIDYNNFNTQIKELLDYLVDFTNNVILDLDNNNILKFLLDDNK